MDETPDNPPDNPAKEQGVKPDFRIARDGTWYHDGAPIRRIALAKLFSDRALKMDAQGNYWLQTPFEKYSVEVEDVPYVINDYEYCPESGVLTLTSNMGEQVEVSENNPLELRDNVPYINLRDGLFARIARAPYYNLIEQFGDKIKSHGQNFLLGEWNETEE